MTTFEVDTDLVVHCRVRLLVEASDKEAAVDAAAELLPSNFERGAADQWRAKVELKAPAGVRIKVLRAYHFEQASGNDKARKAREL
jgi:hypothetical protein